ncbi:hypothetical protein [Pseudooceanicola sp. 200-1SW]|uniref:hypothetical protein n=1 Tax=Pseudooceanicola sp. 200-1SW TaxID=3425949 RepID=UPI003D7F7715
MSPMPTRRERFKRWSRRALVRIRRTLPPGTRLPVGLLLMLGGVLGFLPIVGFWMLPLGLAVAALDVAPLIRRLRGR